MNGEFGAYLWFALLRMSNTLQFGCFLGNVILVQLYELNWIVWKDRGRPVNDYEGLQKSSAPKKFMSDSYDKHPLFGP